MERDPEQNRYMDMGAAEKRKKLQKLDNNNERVSSNYEDMTHSSLLPPASAPQNKSGTRVVELDEDGNELEELPRVPPSRVPRRYVRIPSGNPELDPQSGSLVPSPQPLDEQICLSNGQDNLDGGYLEPHHHIYEEITERKKTVEVTPTGSRIVTFEERTRRIPRSIRRLHSRISGKPMDDGYEQQDYIKCTCNKRKLCIILAIITLLIAVLTVVIVITLLVSQSEPETEKVSAFQGSRRDIIFPTITCPPSTTVRLRKYKQNVQLHGADATDNIGISSLEYIPEIMDDSAEYQVPDTLVLSRSSVGSNYTVLAKTRDVDGNEVQCKFYVAVTEDSCVPWNRPETALAKRHVVETADGWSVRYECSGRAVGVDHQGAPHPLSYHYPDQTVTFTCTSGSQFTPRKLFSCQEPKAATYSYITSLNYQYLDHDGSKLQNITTAKTKSCFKDYYADKLLEIQSKLSTRLKDSMIQAASTLSMDISDMELVPSTVDYPTIQQLNDLMGRVQSIGIALGYHVGPEGQAFPSTALNVFVKGILRRDHNTLFSEAMLPFSRLKGNVAAGCPDIQAPPDVSIFDEIASGFSCSTGDKEYEYYDEHLKTQLTVCLGCPLGEFYNKETKLCEECPLNSYQDIVGSLECKLCPLNEKTDITGARSIQECVPIN